jgi:Zn finger protein HypA/HybF involved in hydrogenase expression
MALELLQSNERILIKQISTMTTNQPSAYIALNNNRLRAYADVIYLKDGDEFQIEIFNPYKVSVLAKIYINNSLISTSGLVIRPGQRYFLDRFIDKNKKFKFNTYTVDPGTTPEVLESIKNNGSVRVEFYKETMSRQWTGIPSASWNSSPFVGQQYTGNVLYSSNTGSSNPNPITFTTTSSTMNVNASINAHVSSEIETGRIEGGSKSKQNFSTTNQDFEFLTCAVSEWKILPDSHKPLEVNEIRNYCSSCGTRMKKQSWKFCPNCGEKLD